MHLLVITQYFWPENFRINDLVADFVEKGHQVTVLTGVPNYPDGNVFEGYRRKPADFDHYAGARVVRVPMLARGRGAVRLVLNYFSFAACACLWGSWRLRGECPDAILVYEPSPVTVGVPGAWFRWLKTAPMAFWVLDLWPETLEAVGVVRSAWALRTVGHMVRWIYRRCDLILAQSKSFIPQIRRYAGDVPRIAYFPSWAEALFTGDDRVLAAPELELSPGSFTVLFAGNIGEAQDFPSILEAAQRVKLSHPHIRWVILGDGRMKPWVDQQIIGCGLGSCVRMMGRFPVERMPSFFKGADALLVSLRREPIFAMTIPGKLQSYLAAGRPVVAMLDGEGSDLLRNAEAGMTCAAGDPAGLADAVVRLSQMSEVQRMAMGRKGLALYEQEFEREMLLKRLETWMLELQRPPLSGVGKLP